MKRYFSLIGKINGYPLYFYENYESPLGITEYKGKTVLVSGPSLEFFTKEERLTIFQHEMGHKHFHHIKGNVDPLEAEIQADKYAASIVGKEALSLVLKKSLDLARKHKKEDTVRIMLYRIKAVC